MNINNIKIVIFDFDDTLAIHKDKDYLKHRNESEDRRLSYYLNGYLNPETFYEDIEPCVKSEDLYNFINKLRNNNIKMYCLSGMKFSFLFKAKQNFINKHYGNDIELISTGSQQLKIDSVKIIQRINNCNLDEILFVDDISENIIRLNNIGVCSLLSSEIDSLLVEM